MAKSDELRAEFSEGDRTKNAGLTTPEDIIRHDNIAYDTKDSTLNLLDVYYPKDTRKPLPVIISVHGGGWVYGSKDGYQFYCMSLAQHGFTVVNFSYRLAPEHPFPANLEDINSVAGWVMKHADQYYMDLSNIFMVGDSAGGNLAALYAGLCTNPDAAGKYSFPIPEGFSIKALGLNCGVYDLVMEIEQGESDSRDLMAEVFGTEDFKKYLPLMSPVCTVTENYPLSFLLTAEDDFLKIQAPRMSEVLTKYGIAHELHFCRGTDYRLYHDFHCDMRLPEAHLINKKECEFFRKYTNSAGYV